MMACFANSLPGHLLRLHLCIAMGCALVGAMSCGSPQASQEVDPPTLHPSMPLIKGVYGSPGSLWKAGYSLPELGVNAVFVRSHAIDSALVARARAEGAKVFAEFATLNGKNYVQEHPEAWAINAQGERVEAASWFMGVCPTEPGFRAYRQQQLTDLLQAHELDGVWMDYVHWHAQFEEPEPILPATCFCDHCRAAFEAAAGISLPEGDVSTQATFILDRHDAAWRDWRCRVIVDWARELKAILRAHRPEALLGLYHCPWTDEEYGGARRRVLGLDYDLLAEVVDVFSPMVYHERMQRPPAWVQENLLWFRSRLDETGQTRPIWPIVQAHEVEAAAFEQVLKAGLQAGRGGVMMFTSRAVAADTAKRAVLQALYQAP